MRKYWIFTFGCGQPHAGKAVKIAGEDFFDARQKMINKYGEEWAFQYSEDNWNKMEKDPNRCYEMEEIMEVIE